MPLAQSWCLTASVMLAEGDPGTPRTVSAGKDGTFVFRALYGECNGLRTATYNMLVRNGFKTTQDIICGYEDLSLAACVGNGMGKKRFTEIQAFVRGQTSSKWHEWGKMRSKSEN